MANENVPPYRLSQRSQNTHHSKNNSNQSSLVLHTLSSILNHVKRKKSIRLF